MFKIYNFTKDSKMIDNFDKLSSQLYRNDPFMLAKKESYPDDSCFFIIFKNNRIAGRCCGIINNKLSYNKKKIIILGFYECIDDIETSKHLIEYFESYYNKQEYNYIIGPMNGSTWQSYRITTTRNAPFFLDNYHKQWYKSHFEENNFSRISSYISTVIERENFSFKRQERFEALFSKKGISIRSVDLNNFESDIKKIYDISIKSFANNFLYTPINYSDYSAIYKSIEKLIDPKYVLIAEDNNKVPLGFIFAVNNHFSRDKKSLIIKSLAVIPDRKAKGLGTLLVEKMHKTAYENNFEEIIHALMYTKNISANIGPANSTIYQTYSLYGKEI